MSKVGRLAALWRIGAISSPLWAPLLTGYAFALCGELFEESSASVSEGSVAIAGIVAIVTGFFTVLLLPNTSRIGKIFLVILYLCVSPIILFISGWGGMLASGHGH